MFGFNGSSKELASKVEWLDTLSTHCGVGLWDAVLYEGDAMHPKARWTWSAEFRRLCGFSSEKEFPNVVQVLVGPAAPGRRGRHLRRIRRDLLVRCRLRRHLSPQGA